MSPPPNRRSPIRKRKRSCSRTSPAAIRLRHPQRDGRGRRGFREPSTAPSLRSPAARPTSRSPRSSTPSPSGSTTSLSSHIEQSVLNEQGAQDPQVLKADLDRRREEIDRLRDKLRSEQSAIADDFAHKSDGIVARDLSAKKKGVDRAIERVQLEGSRRKVVRERRRRRRRFVDWRFQLLRRCQIRPPELRPIRRAPGGVRRPRPRRRGHRRKSPRRPHKARRDGHPVVDGNRRQAQRRELSPRPPPAPYRRGP